MIPVSLKVRIPKAGTYMPEPVASADLLTGKLKSELDENKEPKIKGESSKKSKKGIKSKDGEFLNLDKLKKEEVKEEPSPQSSSSTPMKVVPQCLKFKLSNGKMVRYGSWLFYT